MRSSTIHNEAGNNNATLPMVAMEKELSQVALQEVIILVDSSSIASSDENGNDNSKNNTNAINNQANLSERKSKSGNNSRTRRSSASVLRATKKLLINKSSYSTSTISSTKKEKEKQEKKEERYQSMKTNNNAMMNSRMSSLGLLYDLELERGGGGGREGEGGEVFERKEELNKEQEEREEEVEICFFDDENWRDKLEVHNGNDEIETELESEGKYEMYKRIIENCYKNQDSIVEFEEEEKEEEEEDYAIQSFDHSLLEVSDNLDRALQDIVNHEHETTTTTAADNSNGTFNRCIERRKKEQNRHNHGNSNNNRNRNQNNSGNTIISFYSSSSEDEDEEDTNNNCAPYKLAPGSVTNALRYRLWNACSSSTDGETKIVRRIVCCAGIGLFLIVVLFSIIRGTAVHTTNHSSSLRGGGDPATIIAVGYTDYNWNELPLTVQNAATKLGWKQQSWNRNIETEVYKKEWEDLSTEQKATATVLGFQKGTWCTDNDDNYNHNDDDDDDDDDEEGTEKVPTDASLLDTTTVLDATTHPETTVDDYLYRDVDWMELPTDLKNVAIALGYNQEIWDAGDRDRGTNNILPLDDTGILDTNGDPLTHEEHKDAALLMNTINNIQQQQVSTSTSASTSLFDDTSSSPGTMNTLLPETTIDDFFYCDKNWSELAPGLQQLALALGYTPEIWDTPGDNIPQETFDTNWGHLTSTEQKNAAILLFGYTEETWIDDPVWEEEYSDQIMTQLNMKQQTSSSSLSTPETITIPDKESDDDDDDDNDNDDQSKDAQPSTSSSVVRVVPATKSPATTTTQKRNDEDWIELSKHHHHYPV